MGDFEDHCWRDLFPPDVLEIYRHYKRELRIGPRPALLLIDLYRLAYAGGPLPVAEVVKTHPSSCGIAAWAAVPPTLRLIAAARAKNIPIFYTTGRAPVGANAGPLQATNRKSRPSQPSDFEIQDEFKPEDRDVIIVKERASAFFGTLLTAQLTRLGIQSLIVAGEATSGCVRASAVDAYSHGYHVSVAEECCFDRSELSHKVNLFDLHHKYADVMGIDEMLGHISDLKASS